MSRKMSGNGRETVGNGWKTAGNDLRLQLVLIDFAGSDGLVDPEI